MLGYFSDEVLLALMQYLDAPALLACRLVCKRLGSLALEPCLWKHQRVHHADPCAGPVLRLAPCLGELSVGPECCPTSTDPVEDLEDLPLEWRRALYITTGCAVAELRLTVNDRNVAFAALVIRKQAALGRLRRLHVLFSDFRRDADASLLLSTVASTRGLERVVLPTVREYHCGSCSSLESLLRSAPGPVASSLKHFCCRASPPLKRFINVMLAAHAATLEVVELADGAAVSGLTETATLLAGMPNLRELRTALLPGLQVAAACESLREVTLFVRSETRGNVEDAREFLSRADQLRAVSLRYSSWPVKYPDGVGASLDLCRALAGPYHRPLLESLVILDDHSYKEDRLYPHLQAVLDALPSLPALRHLELNAVLDGLVGSITPATAPALRTLRLHRFVGSGKTCAHSYLHGGSAQALLRDNPALDLHVYAPYYCDTEEDTQDNYWPCKAMPMPSPCEACVLGCHEGMIVSHRQVVASNPYADFVGHTWVNITRCLSGAASDR